jgi:hypothetical protein
VLQCEEVDSDDDDDDPTAWRNVFYHDRTIVERHDVSAEEVMVVRDKEATYDDFITFMVSSPYQPKPNFTAGHRRRHMVWLLMSLMTGAFGEVADNLVRSFVKKFRMRATYEFVTQCDVACQPFAAPTHPHHSVFLQFLSVFRSDDHTWTCIKKKCQHSCAVPGGDVMHFSDLVLCWVLQYMQHPGSEDVNVRHVMKVVNVVLATIREEDCLLTPKWLVSHAAMSIDEIRANLVFQEVVLACGVRVCKEPAVDALMSFARL